MSSLSAAEAKTPGGAAAPSGAASAAAHDTVAVVDFGGQYAHLIATKIRQANVKAEILLPEDPIEKFAGFKGVVLSGGPALISQGDEGGLTAAILDLPVPILGICFGHQQIASTYGGTVEGCEGNVEWGFTTLHIVKDHPLFEGLEKTQTVWMSHFDTVTQLGEGFEQIGYTETDHSGGKAADGGGAAEVQRGPNAAIANDALQRYGFQFHVEVDSTVNGDRMLRNFVCNICKCVPSWKVDAEYLEVTLQSIRDEVAGRGVFLLASGGVDSTVAAKLFQLALPPGQLKLLHIDNGMMRKDESAQVVTYFDQLGLSDALTFVDATDEFLAALAGECEPEKKRTIIGNQFIAVYEREAARMGIEGYVLGQGTIYPDTIESGGAKHAKVIKTHHNRVPLIEQMIADGLVSEPLKELYKTEVRALARQLGVPHALLSRHPFPGPGLGVRLLCAKGDGRGNDVSAALAATLAPFPALSGHVLPIKSVGVKADVRSYEHPCMITADPALDTPSWEVLLEACRLVLRDVPGVNRVVYNLAGTAAPKVCACVHHGAGFISCLLAHLGPILSSSLSLSLSLSISLSLCVSLCLSLSLSSFLSVCRSVLSLPLHFFVLTCCLTPNLSPRSLVFPHTGFRWPRRNNDQGPTRLAARSRSSGHGGTPSPRVVRYHLAMPHRHGAHVCRRQGTRARGCATRAHQAGHDGPSGPAAGGSGAGAACQHSGPGRGVRVCARPYLKAARHD